MNDFDGPRRDSDGPLPRRTPAAPWERGQLPDESEGSPPNAESPAPPGALRPQVPLTGPIPRIPPDVLRRMPPPNNPAAHPVPPGQLPPAGGPVRQGPPSGSMRPVPPNGPRRQPPPPSAPLRQVPPGDPARQGPPNEPPRRDRQPGRPGAAGDPARQGPSSGSMRPVPPNGMPWPAPPNGVPRRSAPPGAFDSGPPSRPMRRPAPGEPIPPNAPARPAAPGVRPPHRGADAEVAEAGYRYHPPGSTDPTERISRRDTAAPDRAGGYPRTAAQVAVAPARPAGDAGSRLLSNSGSIAIATLISRITGFGKQLLLLTVLGPAIASAFTVASQIPTMVEQLVLGAVLTAFVVPTLVRAEKEDTDGGAAFVRRLVTMAFMVLATAALLCTAAAPILIKYIFLSDSGKVSTGLTTALAYLLLPAILCYGMSSLLMAILNTHELFKPGAWAPVLNNVVVLAVLSLYALTPGEISLHPVRMGEPKLLILGLGVTCGVLVQVVSLVPPIRRAGIDLRPLWGVDARLKQFGGMATAVILYVFISQAGFVFGTRISSHADVAGPAIYNNAWLLLQLPYGVLGVTVLTAIMPRLSRDAAADDTPAVVDDLSAATRLTMISLLPVVLFLTVAGPQVGKALYGYGHFGHAEATRLGETVSWSAFTLIPYALVLIHLRVFYAREQAWTPTWIILGITSVRMVLSAVAPYVVGEDHVVIALSVANGIGYIAGAIIGGWLLHRSLGDIKMANVGRTITRVVLASVAGAAVTLIVDQLLGLPRLHSVSGSMFRVVIDAVVMFGVAFGLMRLVGIPEIVSITVAISRRLGITPPAPDLDLGQPDADMQDTMVLPRFDAAPYYYRYEPYMDTQTMVLPVIRAGAVDRTGAGEFPYPVRQRNANAEPGTHQRPDPEIHDHETGVRATPGYPTTHQGEGGTSVSDDAGAVPAADAAAAAGAVRTDDVQPGAVPGDRHGEDQHGEPPAESQAGAPSRDPVYDTGMMSPVSPEMPPMRVEPPMRRLPRGPKLMPGASVAGGRYRLLADHGGARGLRFWQALDVKLDREVALTFVDAEQKATENSGQDGPQAILSRTLRLGRINSPGLARVLDVVRGSSGGIVVAEWTPGRSLREMAETRPSPIGAARAIRALAAAAELAHRGGGSLSIDHPDRVRISATGDAVLAFPGTLSDSEPQADVRGLGAMLYALMTARWPIRIGGVSGAAANVGGLPLADFGPDGTPVEPRQIRPEVPFEISAVAVRSLESNKGVRTAATVQHVLEQASVVDQKTDFIPVLRLGQRATAPSDSLADPELLAAEKERSQRMVWILVGLGILAALAVGVIIWWLLSVFAPSSSNAPLNEQRQLGLTTANTAPVDPSTAGAGSAPGAPQSATGGVPVPVTGASVFSPEGTPDNPGSVTAVLDGNPATMWRTDQYFQQFPALKKGVGILTTLGSPSKLTKVTIDSPSAGTVVEIRTSPTAATTLDQTQLIGQATLADGATSIAVRADQPARYVLVWITSLANSGGQYQSSIADIRFEAAP